MAQFVLFDEFHLTVYVPQGLPETEVGAISRTLDSGWCPPNVADLRGVAVQHLK